MSIEDSNRRELAQPQNAEQRGQFERNLNEIVWVKITDAGVETWRNYYRRIGMGDRIPGIQRDAEGWTRIQLWEVAQIFGREMYNGNPYPSVEMVFRMTPPGQEVGTAPPGKDVPEAERNLNEIVWIKITKSGEEAWNRYRKGNISIEKDADGWTRIQLWEVAAIFGDEMYNAATLPVETNFLMQPRKNLR